LKGSKDGVTRFKWYHGQKQLFEIFQIPKEAYNLQVNWKRATLKDFVEKSPKILC